jgi:membrane protein DedA with SNARE-associated domain/rhodanese-related sulfurtransferase
MQAAMPCCFGLAIKLRKEIAGVCSQPAATRRRFPMNEIVHHLERHSYSVLFACVFARQACLPVPALLFLIAAGALAGNGNLSLATILCVSVVASVLADLLWYEAGRLRGNDVLHFIHRFSSMPDSSVSRIKRHFARYGPKLLLVSKLVIGLDAITPPLAGMSGTSTLRFMRYDAGGALLWAGLYAGVGYAFHSELDKGIALAQRLGALLSGIVGIVIAVFLGRRLLYWYDLIRQLRLARITPEGLKQKLDRREEIFIVDVQGCILHHVTNKVSIPGAICIDGRRLEKYRDSRVPAAWRTHEVVLYCSCPAEITSARVALLLRGKGVSQVRPLAGGLQAWIDCGFPIIPNPIESAASNSAEARA